MTDFWVVAMALLLAVGALLGWPLMVSRRQAAAPRDTVNVQVYEERLAGLREEHEAGRLEDEAWEAAKVEAAKALLADVPGQQTVPLARGNGRWLVGAVMVLVPAAAIALYLHFGALGRLELARELATPARSPEQALSRLERTVQAQPDAPDAVFLLARTYMAQNRAAEAVPLFAQAAQLAGRPPALLGQWAQALYFAANRQWSADIQALVDEALQGDPNESTSLGLLGIAAFEGKHWAAAAAYWARLQAGLAPNDPTRATLQAGIDRARHALKEEGGAQVQGRRLNVTVKLAPSVATHVSPQDTVFVFARAAGGPPVPLAVKRLRVADLPTTLVLSDADAMQPALKLSGFGEVHVMARVSRAGQPLHGEWVGAATHSGDTYTLTIDSPETRP